MLNIIAAIVCGASSYLLNFVGDKPRRIFLKVLAPLPILSIMLATTQGLVAKAFVFALVFELTNTACFLTAIYMETRSIPRFFTLRWLVRKTASIAYMTWAIPVFYKMVIIQPVSTNELVITIVLSILYGTASGVLLYRIEKRWAKYKRQSRLNFNSLNLN